MTEDITLNNKEKKIILLVRDIIEQETLGRNLNKVDLKTQYSKKGLKKGCKFTDSSGNKVNISPEKNEEMISFIQDEIINYERQRVKMYGPLIIKKVNEKFNIHLSPAFVNGIKKKIGESNGC